MVRAYELFIEIDPNKINGKIFNVGFENKTVNELALSVKSVIGDDVKINTLPTDDNRSYHVSSQKIFKELGFEAKFTIEDAVIDLKNAFDNKLLKNTLENIDYFNIKKMQNLKLS